MHSRLVLLAVLVCAIASAGSIPDCTTSSLSGLMAQGTCAMGDLAIHFLSTSYWTTNTTGGGTLLPPSSSGVTFTPVIGPAGTQGFRFSGISSQTTPGTTGEIDHRVYVDFTLTDLNGNAVNLQAGTSVVEAYAHIFVTPDCTEPAPAGCSVTADSMTGVGVVGGNWANAGAYRTGMPGWMPGLSYTGSETVDIGQYDPTDTWRVYLTADAFVGVGGSASSGMSGANFWFTEVQGSEVPEPSTAALLAAGGALLAARYRKLRRA